MYVINTMAAVACMLIEMWYPESVMPLDSRNAGYIAVNAGIACGATEIITQEMPYDLDNIAKKMLETRKSGKQHFIIMVSEGIGNSSEIADILQEKTGIEARATILGHVQRGGSPSVRDRVLASQMGFYAVQLLKNDIGNRVVASCKEKIVDYDIIEALNMKKTIDLDLYRVANEISI